MHRPGNRPGTGLRIAVPVTAATLLLLAPGAGAASAVDRPTDPGELTLIDTAAGPALADRAGNPLYLRTADRSAGLRCTGECARTWPAATGFPAKGRGVTALTSRTVLRAANSGRPQVVYNGHPLYYYKNDRPNRPQGQHVPGFSLVAPNGTALTTGAGAGASRSPGPAASPRPSASGTISATSRARPPATATATATATRKAPSLPKAPSVPKTSAVPKPAVTPRASVTTRRSSAVSSPSVGALRVTPSGAARGGADHPVAAAEATGPADRDRVARLALAIGTTAAASAGTILVVRRLQRRATGGEP
ncbi:hypothetical protein PUR57_16880 [Streptomyces sp. JV176]|uniref:hypothetical protein n=1 Tax=Streptomyces sp. JV176 TaxID=858630 RepID=UPI002E75B7D2|nr:hypothetical protein [Streptomyces sp. JV176]MEE1800320.1 hypothetical protein [Streptomyces sp. JV176]